MRARLAKLKFRIALWLWARAVPLLAYRRDLPSLIDAVGAPGPRPAYAGLPADYIVKRVRGATRRPFLMRDRPCLRQGLLAYRFLQLAGYSPELRFGVDRSSVEAARLSAHCWVLLGGKTLLNAPDRPMIEVLAVHSGHDGRARLAAASAAGA